MNFGTLGTGFDGMGRGGAGAQSAALQLASKVFSSGVVGAFYAPSERQTVLVNSDGSGGQVAYDGTVGRISDISGNNNHAIQATSGDRPLYGQAFLRGDSSDRLTSAAGGGASTAFYFCVGIMSRNLGAARYIFADSGTNTGILFQITAANILQVSIGNGSGYTSAAPTGTLADGVDYILEAFYDGTTLTARINNSSSSPSGVKTATGSLTAGTSNFYILSRVAAANFFTGRLYGFVYTKNYLPDAALRTEIYNWMAADIAAQNRPSLSPRFYVDSSAGSDTNDGLSRGLAKATVADVADYTVAANDCIGLDDGSAWREKLTIATDYTKVVAVGSGSAPELRCDDVLTNASFVKTVGRTNIYEYSLAVQTDANGAEWPGIWVDGTRLTFAANLATCDSTPGTFYHGTVTDTTPITLYVHPPGSTDPTADGKVYEAPIRTAGVDTYSAQYATVSGIKARRNYSSYGSIVGGRYSLIKDCVVVDGNTHNMLVRAGSTVRNCTFLDAYNHTTSPTLLVCFDTSPPAGVVVEDCDFSLTTYNANMIGSYMHVSSGNNFPSLLMRRCTFDNIGQPMSAANCDLVTATDCEISNFVTGFKFGCNATITGLVISAAKSGGVLGISDAAGITWVIDGATGTFNSTGNLFSVHNNTDFTLKNSTLVGMNTILRGTGTGQRWTHRNNTYTGGLASLVFNLPADAIVDSDYNSYGGAAGGWKLGSTTYPTLADWQNATGQDMHSEA